MCGINGFNFSDQNLIQKMNQASKHRGPDETNFLVDDGVSLGHNRLAIIDLSPNGCQPMWDADHTVVIVFNGEIYNYQELKNELKEYKFNSKSDTEVILNAYKKFGVDCVKKFNGIFAFAIWDTKTKTLFLARDQGGVKPLYYFYDQGKLIFSSEIKSILEHPIKREVNTEAYNLFFQLLYVPEPLTMFANVRKLLAGHYAVVKNGEMKIVNYWPQKNNLSKRNYSETVGEIRDVFRDSVKHQLISDRPVGIFLSGGLDSTAVLGAAAEFHQGPIKTFTVGFADSQDPKKFNADLDLARKTAAFYHTDHHELILTPRAVLDSLEELVWHLDEPNFNATAGAIFALAAKAKESVAVVLGGDGADELFGGYPRYYYSRLISLYQKTGWLGQTFAKTGQALGFGLAHKLNLPPTEARVLAFLAQKQELLSTLLGPQYEPAAATNFLHTQYFLQPPTTEFENYFMQIDREGWLRDESLMRTDKMTMAHGLEARVPILDHRLVSLSEQIPVNWKFSIWQNPHTFQGKNIWKEAIKGYLPDHVLNQEKRGWFTPMAKWVRSDLKESVAEILADAKQNTAYFSATGIDQIWNDHLSGRQYNLNSIWATVMWQLWYNRFIK